MGVTRYISEETSQKTDRKHRSLLAPMVDAVALLCSLLLGIRGKDEQ